MKIICNLLILSVLFFMACNHKKTLSAVPDYRAPEYKKDTIALREAVNGKVAVVNLWFTTCIPCLKEIPFLVSVYDTYSINPNFAFYSVAANTTSELGQFLDPATDSTNIYRRTFLRYNLPTITYPILVGTAINRQIKKGADATAATAYSKTDRESMDEITRQFKSNVYPTTLVFDKNGKEVFRESGFALTKAERYKQKLMRTIDSCLAL